MTQKAKIVHFVEVRFIGGLVPDNLKKVREDMVANVACTRKRLAI